MGYHVKRTQRTLSGSERKEDERKKCLPSLPDLSKLPPSYHHPNSQMSVQTYSPVSHLAQVFSAAVPAQQRPAVSVQQCHLQHHKFNDIIRVFKYFFFRGGKEGGDQCVTSCPETYWRRSRPYKHIGPKQSARATNILCAKYYISSVELSWGSKNERVNNYNNRALYCNTRNSGRIMRPSF